MITHREARVLVAEGFRRVFSREPTRAQAQCCQAIGWLETQYGWGWQGGPGQGSNNIGAITKGSGWTGPTFEHRDSEPRDDGSSRWYVTQFRAYPTAAAGFEDLVRGVFLWLTRDLYVLPPATRGDLEAFSRALYNTGYYKGFGATPEQRIEGHWRKVLDACARFARELGEPMPDGSDAPPAPPRILRATVPPMRGEDVGKVQELVGATVDGVYGPKTAAAVAAWQRARGLKSDGVWGPVSRATAERLAKTDPAPPPSGCE